MKLLYCKKQSKEPKPILTFNIIIFNYIKLINIDEVIDKLIVEDKCSNIQIVENNFHKFRIFS